MNRTHAREGITYLPSYLDLSHIVTLATSRALRNCLFSSDAAQWWPGVWPWTPGWTRFGQRWGGY
jgi:hypothetical protein